jgi:NAD(P)-dependent dehydrogenase (short-subunit alcohol dehydrogenase family)
MQKIWFVTGASRGLGVEIARAALWSGDRVVAAGRNKADVTKSLGPDSDQLLSVDVDVTRPDQVEAAVQRALATFGGIDVLVNNAGYGHLGFFEETTMADAQAQFATNLFGVFTTTWAVLPSMRAARKGLILNISSLAGILGFELAALYCASKFALEGFSESLAKEVKPFGIGVTIIEPGPFRTDFLTPDSLRFGEQTVADYDCRRAQMRQSFEERNGRQQGDPAKLADAIVGLARGGEPPMRLIAGSIAVDAADAKLGDMRAELDRQRLLSKSMDGDYAA